MDDDLLYDGYLDEWLTLQRTRIEPTTWHSYKTMLQSYVRPHLGTSTLASLTVRRLDLFYVQLLQGGGRRGRPLSRRTVAYVHAIVHKTLRDAVAVGLLDENAAERATVPRIDPNRDAVPTTVSAWDTDQAARFLELTEGDELHDLWRVTLGTGMRRGELLGLRWEDVDLAVPQLRVATALTYVEGRLRLKGTKTGRARVLILDADTAAAIDRQPRRGDPWPLVFTQADGSPYRPNEISDRWRRQWPALDGEVPRLRYHDLRHCHATLLIGEGVPIKVVQERLGHRSITMTMDLYTHVLPAMDHDAADAIGRALRRR